MLSSDQLDQLEHTRLHLQQSLDAARTQAERNRLGQFATPPALAADILAYARSVLPSDQPVRFLDPAFGTGAFFTALLRAFPSDRIAAATGYEIDPHYGDPAGKLWDTTPLHLHITDFTQATPPAIAGPRANLLICNPPYVRHHHLPGEVKQRLQRAATQATGLRLNGLAGLYCYFLCIAHTWMAPDGLAGWLIPSEFMDVNYGEQIKKYLLSQVTLVRIHRYAPEDGQFADALVSSALVWFRNAPPRPDHTVAFTYGGTLAHPAVSAHIPADHLRATAKWTGLPHTYALPHPTTAELRLSDLFRIQRGVATGANHFFVLTPEQIVRHALPLQFLMPILPSPRYVPPNEIAANNAGEPMLERRLFLLRCDLPEERVRMDYPTLWSYLQSGVQTGVSGRYLCRHRTPWYTQDVRPPAPLLCTYMGRKGSGRPFRFLLNHSQATAPNVYLLLYPQPLLAQALQAQPDLLRTIWQLLNQIPLEALVGAGRVYGGGLHKMEPRELGNVTLPPAALPELMGRQVSQLTLWAE